MPDPLETSRGIQELRDSDFELRYDNGFNVRGQYLVSIVTPNYNRGPLLLNLLDTLCCQHCDYSQVEMVISDDGGEAAEVDEIRKLRLPFRLRYYWQPDLGRRAGRARNIGVRNACGEIVIFLDSDALASPNLIRDHVARHSRHPRLALCGELRVAEKGQLPGFAHYLGVDAPPGRIFRTLASLAKREWMKPAYYKLTGLNLGLSFCSMHASARRRDLMAVNGFDEAFDGRWGDEDLELGYRLERSGVKMCFSSRSFVYHQWHPVPKVLERLDNRLKLFVKHPEVLPLKTLNGFSNPFRRLDLEAIRQVHVEEETELFPDRCEPPAVQLRYDNQPEAKNHPVVSLVVSTCNRELMVEQFLECVARQTLPPDQFEVVIADNGSTDRTSDIVRNKTLPFRLRHFWRQPTGFGMATNRNLGVQHTRGEIIVLADMDALLPDHYLQMHREYHRGRRRRVVTNCCCFLKPGGMPAPNRRAVPPVFSSLQWKRWLEDIRLSYLAHLDRQGQFDFSTVWTSLQCSFRREDFLEAQGFDPVFDPVWGDEDTDFFYRLQKSGFEIHYGHELTVYHRGHALAPTRIWCFENRCQLMAKHPELTQRRFLNRQRNSCYGWDYCRIRCTYVETRRLRLLCRIRPELVAQYRGREARKAAGEKWERIWLVLLPGLLYRLGCRLAAMTGRWDRSKRFETRPSAGAK